MRSENKDDFISIAYLILVNACDYVLRKGWNNSQAFIRAKIRWELDRHVGRTDDGIHCQVKEYLLDTFTENPLSLYLAHETAYKRSLSRNGNGTLTRDALNYARSML